MNHQPEKTLTHLDLFSGIGGFAIAAQACGYTTIGFCEKEKYAQQILKERFGAVLADAASEQDNGERGDCKCGRDAVGRNQQAAWRRNGQADNNRACGRHPILHDNIFTLNGADYAGVDLLTGGFPCQPFSVAGKRKGAADDRALWPEMLRVIDGAKPAWLIGENVAGIVTMELDNILSDLEAIGYAAWPLVIPACAVDARHRRDRVWIVAHADDSRERTPRGRIDGVRQSEENARGQVLQPLPRGQGEDVAHAEDTERNGRRHGTGRWGEGEGDIDGAGEERALRWLPEPELGRVAHGIPHRAHRLRGLGNAIVPQVAEKIIRAILKTTETQNKI